MKKRVRDKYVVSYTQTLYVFGRGKFLLAIIIIKIFGHSWQ